MPLSVYQKSLPTVPAALRQGEILTGIKLYQIDYLALQRESVEAFGDSKIDEDVEKKGEVDETQEDLPLFDETTYPYAIIVTQDCDLEQDFGARFPDKGNTKRKLKNILFCEMVVAQNFINEVEELRTSETLRKQFFQNNDFRYHFLEAFEDDMSAKIFPDLCVNFKTYFTVPTDYLYHLVSRNGDMRKGVLQSPYLEHFASRFHYYHSRVALPENHKFPKNLKYS